MVVLDAKYGGCVATFSREYHLARNGGYHNTFLPSVPVSSVPVFSLLVSSSHPRWNFLQMNSPPQRMTPLMRILFSSHPSLLLSVWDRIMHRKITKPFRASDNRAERIPERKKTSFCAHSHKMQNRTLLCVYKRSRQAIDLSVKYVDFRVSLLRYLNSFNQLNQYFHLHIRRACCISLYHVFSKKQQVKPSHLL